MNTVVPNSRAMENPKTTPPSRLLLWTLAAFAVAALLGLQTFVLKTEWNKEPSVQKNIQTQQITVKKSVSHATSQKRVTTKKLRHEETWDEPSFLNASNDKNVVEANKCLRGLVVSTLGIDGWKGVHTEPLGVGAVFLHVASAWAVAHFHDVKAVVPQRTINRLKDMFFGVDKLVKPLEAVVQLRRKNGKFPCQEIDIIEAGWAHPFEDWEGHGLRLLTEGPLILRSGSVYPAYIAPLVPELRKTLELRKRYRTWAETRLHKIRSSLTRFSLEEEPWSLVAVHAHQPWSVAGIHSDGDLPISFYPRAVTWLRAQLWKELRGNHVLLAVISFNYKWATGTLVPLLRKSMHGSEGVSVEWVGAMSEKSDEEAEKMDLALLMLCDHAVAAYGDLPTAASLLNEGLFTFWALGPSNVTTAFSWMLPDWKMLL